MKKLFQEELYKLTAYTPGEQPKGKIVKLNTNENPYPPSSKFVSKIQKIFKEGILRKYPNPISNELRKEIAKLHNLKEENILVTNGSDEALAILFRACLNRNSIFIMPDPTYSLYSVLTSLSLNGSRVQKIPLTKNFHLDFDKLKSSKGDLLAFANPNAPTGILETKKEILDLVVSFQNAVLCDEAYIDFAPKNSSLISEVKNFPNLFISRTFSKSYSLAGLRVGYLIGKEENIFELMKIKDSYNVGMIEQIIATEAIKDQKSLLKNTKKIILSRNKLKLELENLGFKILESNTNFLFASLDKENQALKLFEYLKSKNIFVRYFKEEITKKFIRISIGTEKENSILLKEIKRFLEN